ncbi:hypothetical protein T4C_6106 [Trichinella pseudospiralis]|uniref:Uncharacterized protein n=1 Tax=Trichinella pseudospiralis TaxID=6337 RepID=A0A0V1IWN5_TRIPS|nr:hypothetical protein T4C_10413 [Trichinella pseudospiralis]KRZ27162.1 hypothetical protein T4C_6106 [Trichinella pseudospiralis]
MLTPHHPLPTSTLPTTAHPFITKENFSKTINLNCSIFLNCVKKYVKSICHNMLVIVSLHLVKQTLDELFKCFQLLILKCKIPPVAPKINSNCEKLTLENRFCRTHAIQLSDIIVKII